MSRKLDVVEGDYLVLIEIALSAPGTFWGLEHTTPGPALWGVNHLELQASEKQPLLDSVPPHVLGTPHTRKGENSIHRGGC